MSPSGKDDKTSRSAQNAPAAGPVPVDDQAFVEPSALRFDRENPRFLDPKAMTEEDIIQWLYDQADVDELIQSILSAGYIDFEPMIVWRKDNTVLEGNRRLAALRLIADAGLRQKLKITLPAIADPKPCPPKSGSVGSTAARRRATSSASSISTAPSSGTRWPRPNTPRSGSKKEAISLGSAGRSATTTTRSDAL